MASPRLIDGDRLLVRDERQTASMTSLLVTSCDSTSGEETMAAKAGARLGVGGPGSFSAGPAPHRACRDTPSIRASCPLANLTVV